VPGCRRHAWGSNRGGAGAASDAFRRHPETVRQVGAEAAAGAAAAAGSASKLEAAATARLHARSARHDRGVRVGTLLPHGDTSGGMWLLDHHGFRRRAQPSPSLAWAVRRAAAMLWLRRSGTSEWLGPCALGFARECWWRSVKWGAAGWGRGCKGATAVLSSTRHLCGRYVRSSR